MKKIIPPALVALFPYTPFILFACGARVECVLICTGILLMISAAACVLNLIFSMRNQWSAKALSFVSMIVKLIHIPAYVLLFMAGASGVLFIQFVAITVVVVLFDYITIALSGTLLLSAILRARAENKMKTIAMLICSVCSFVFCIDVILSVIIYFYIRNKEKQISN